MNIIHVFVSGYSLRFKHAATRGKQRILDEIIHGIRVRLYRQGLFQQCLENYGYEEGLGQNAPSGDFPRRKVGGTSFGARVPIVHAWTVLTN